ncbi:MAG: GIY-YIG nuclease family protein [Patescibacteria group bacterium]
MERVYCVYIMTNPSNTVLYIGMTGNLARRVWEHKEHLLPGFTKKYNCTKLVYDRRELLQMHLLKRLRYPSAN